MFYFRHLKAFVVFQLISIVFTLSSHSQLFKRADPYPGCPEILSKIEANTANSTKLCDIHMREWKTKEILRKKAKITNPERISDVLAPKLIDWPYWQKVREKNGFEPLKVYEPAPDTWLQFEKGLIYIQKKVNQNNSQSHTQALSLDNLKQLHFELLGGISGSARSTPGELRRWRNIGQSYFQSAALSEDEIKSLQDTEFKNPNTGNAVVEWVATKCWEDLDEVTKEKNPRDGPNLVKTLMQINKDQFFEYKGRLVQCGYFHYPKREDLEQLLELYEIKISELLKDLDSPSPSTNPIAVAARAQKWFVSMHPFNDGNGRVSRMIMDYILKSYYLPTPTIVNFSNDLILNEKEWTQVLTDGISKTLEIYESCENKVIKKRPKGCNVVPSYIN